MQKSGEIINQEQMVNNSTWRISIRSFIYPQQLKSYCNLNEVSIANLKAKGLIGNL